jgi:aquaporin Z
MRLHEAMRNQSSPRRAPGGPGIEPRWTHGTKLAVGTAYSTSSRVWYTLDAGCVTEVYYPIIDTPQIRDLQFLFTDGASFFHDERRNFTSEVDCISEAALGFEVTNREKEGRYTLHKTILGDPYQNCLLIHIRMEALPQLLSQLKGYVLCAPHLEIGGWHNNGEVRQIADYKFLLAHKGNTGLAIGATIPFSEASCGYVGVNDGWTDLADKSGIDQKPATGVETRAAHRTWLAAAISAATSHWPEYLIEAACLGLFMVSACSFTVLLQHPGSVLRQMLPSAFLRRLFTGVAMGLTAVALIYSPWGKQSGAHLNPSVTLTFFGLGNLEPWDAWFYVAAQFIGETLGVLLNSLIWGEAIAHENVRYAATVPGGRGTGVAFVAELVISFLMMMIILNFSNSVRISRFTGVIAGALVVTYITIESPLSGMSMNPARSFASAAPERLWNSLWIYFTAPPLGMMLAGQVYLWLRGEHAVLCAKVHHTNDKRCIFRCNYQALLTPITLKETI